MRKWWVAFIAVLQPAVLLSATSTRPAPIATASITPELRAVLTRDYEIEVTVKPHEGDAWTRLARRVTGDATTWEDIAAFNESDEKLETERLVRVPFTLLRSALQRDIIETLFPQDALSDEGWKHVVIGSRGIEGESLWKIAEWFTGDGANYTAVRRANPAQALSTRRGDVILVPNGLLGRAFRHETEEENAPKTAAEVRQSQDDPAQRAAADENVPETAPEVVAPVGLPSLTYDRSAADPHAVYRLQKGEALYSSVAIRFTGRVYAKDVGDVLDRIIKYNAIDDVARIRVGYPVKIPMELLLPEYLPADDPTRVAAEATKRESRQMARRTRALGLAGVHVIL
ncbi:MAG TPA: hypothetical protein VN181_14790, partial [Thermoanaerobaculia bacterium]|nr:hypothetical protein [Thermoanaerobaculia bacterium]